jgi:hypothetical protein
MAAFPSHAIHRLQENVKLLHERRKKAGRMVLTHDEYVQLFVPPESREHFRAIAYLMPKTFSSDKFEWSRDSEKLEMRMIRNGEDPGRPIPPPMAEYRIQPDAPADLVARVNEWLDRGGNISRDYGRVAALLGNLNAICSRQAMRYYWPTIISICAQNADTKDYAEELHALKTPAAPKPLPHGLLAACRATAETVNTTLLIPADAPDPGYSGADVTLTVAHQGYTEPGLGTFWGL